MAQLGRFWGGGRGKNPGERGLVRGILGVTFNWNHCLVMGSSVKGTTTLKKGNGCECGDMACSGGGVAV